MIIDMSLGLGDQGAPALARQYAEALEGFYTGLIEVGVPPHLAKLVQRLEHASGVAAAPRPRALVVEADEKSRDDAILLLRETGLDVAGCTRARDAIEYLRACGNDTTFVFCDERLAGERDGVQLVEIVSILWPGIHIVLTAVDGVDPPPGVVRLTKPWRALDLLLQAERAFRPAPLQL